MTPLPETETETIDFAEDTSNLPVDPLDELPNEVEMPFFDHLEELRQRIFYSLIAVVVGIVSCFLVVKPLVRLLEIPAQGIKIFAVSTRRVFFRLPQGCWL